MASERDHRAARMRQFDRLSYEAIAGLLGFPDRRAAHRAVMRALAEPAEDEAQIRGLRVHAMDEQLAEIERSLFVLLERPEPGTFSAAAYRTYFRVMDSLLRVVDERCRLHGLYVRPYRCDLWYRRDVPTMGRLRLQLESRRLEVEARIPLRWRPPKTTPRLAPVVPLHRVSSVPLVDVESLIPADVRRLLERVAA